MKILSLGFALLVGLHAQAGAPVGAGKGFDGGDRDRGRREANGELSDLALGALTDCGGTRNNIGVRIKVRTQSPLKKKARRGFRGYPIATVNFYGPDDTCASKVAVGIIPLEGAKPSNMRRYFSEESDVRHDPEIAAKILSFMEELGAKTVLMTNKIIGCPHEEGKDYPDGETCPECPFWANRDRWAGVDLL